MALLSDNLIRLASTHHGLLHLSHLTDAGISPTRRRTLLRRRTLEQVTHNVLRVRGAPETGFQKALVACWTLRGIMSHRSAAHLHGWPGFRLDEPLEVMVHEPSYRPTRLARLRTVSTLESGDHTTIAALPVSSVERTLLSLAGIAGSVGSGKEIRQHVVENAFDHALSKGQTTERAIEGMLDRTRRSGRSGVRLLDELLTSRRAGSITESHLERLTLQLISKSGLPVPVCQQRIAPNRLFVARVDFIYPEHQAIIEVSGYRWHRSPQQFDRDTERRRHLTQLGFLVYEFTYRQLTEEPHLLIELIESIHQDRAA